MAKTRYAPDRGLTARMTLTMFLLGLVFVAFVAVLVCLLGALTRRQRRHRVLRGRCSAWRWRRLRSTAPTRSR